MEVVFCPHCGGRLDGMDEFWLCKPCKTIWSILDALQAALEEEVRDIIPIAAMPDILPATVRL